MAPQETASSGSLRESSRRWGNVPLLTAFCTVPSSVFLKCHLSLSGMQVGGHPKVGVTCCLFITSQVEGTSLRESHA